MLCTAYANARMVSSPIIWRYNLKPTSVHARGLGWQALTTTTKSSRFRRSPMNHLSKKKSAGRNKKKNKTNQENEGGKNSTKKRGIKDMPVKTGQSIMGKKERGFEAIDGKRCNSQGARTHLISSYSGVYGLCIQEGICFASSCPALFLGRFPCQGENGERERKNRSRGLPGERLLSG